MSAGVRSSTAPSTETTESTESTETLSTLPPERRRLPRRTRYIVGQAAGVAILYCLFVITNTQVVGADTVVPLPWLSDLLYLQDALDMAAAVLLIAGGALLLDRLLARDQAVQSATLAGMARVTALARRIGETGEFHARVPGAENRAPGAVATPAAVTELADTFNAMLGRLEQSFDAQRRLLADTSHELRNPLTVLRTNLALIQREDASGEMRIEAAQEAEEEAARLGRLVDDLLLLGRASAGDFLVRRPVRLDHLLADMAAEAADAGTGHVVECGTLPALTVIGDADRLRQVLRNLVGNVFRHTPPGTQVRLSLVRSGAEAEIMVADTGPGIQAEHLPHLFDRFYRVDAARSRTSEDQSPGASSGAGLGLAIVKHLVDAHGGTVAVESVPGRGLTVRVALPLAQQASHQAR